MATGPKRPPQAPSLKGFQHGESSRDSKTAVTSTTDLRTMISEIGDGMKPGQKSVPVLQVLSGAERGRLISVAKVGRVTLGRSKSSTLVIYDPSCSRNHSEVLMTPDGGATIRDLGSTNGTKINSEKVGAQPVALKDGDRIQMGDNTFLRYVLMPESEAQVQMDVYFRATRDNLTKAMNRHQFEESMIRETALQRRFGHGLGVILFDIDHFKKINDTYGHPGGDEVLRIVGERVPLCVRSEDLFARVGGEEFCVVVRSDNVEGVQILAERIRKSMESDPAEYDGKTIPFTVSVGFTFYTGKNGPEDLNLLRLADDALYEAKKTGRNKCVAKHFSV